MTDDEKRELSKVLEAIDLAETHLRLKNESDAALHCSNRVLHSPLTVKLQLAQSTLARMLSE